jgi:hypothetical protein
MVNFKRLADRAKNVVDKRGGTDALKEDAKELREIAKGKGSLKEKAKAAAEAVKDPGTKGAERGSDKADRTAARGGAEQTQGGAGKAEPSEPRPTRAPEGGTPPPER